MVANSNTARPVEDPNVKIPDAIKAAGANADMLHQQLYSKPEPVEEVVEPVVDKPSDPPLTMDPPADPAPVTSADNTPRPDEDETWERRYNSMKGRHERAQQQINEMSERISSLQNVIAQMQARSAQPEQREQPKYAKLITPEEENDYGQEFLGVVGKKAKEELLPEVEQLRSKLADLEAKYSGVSNVINQSSYDRMLSYLDSNIQGWRDQNNDPEFVSWLKLPDAFSGAIRQKLLMDAWEAHEAPRVAAIFRGFLAEEAAVDPARGESHRPTEVEKVPLETLAAPGRAKTAAGSTESPAEKPTFTQAQITRFYADVAARKYEGREAEKERLEQQIFIASREGRVL